MSDKTLSQRLRELKAAIQGGNNSQASKLAYECIAQAEAQEAKPSQAGELRPKSKTAEHVDSIIEFMDANPEAVEAAWKATEGPCLGGPTIADLEPSQAIGEQTPVAWTTKTALDISERLAGSPFEAITASSRNLWGENGVPLYRSPMSSDARDLAIEAWMSDDDVALDKTIKHWEEVNPTLRKRFTIPLVRA